MLLHLLGQTLDNVRRRLIRQAQITPTADSMKDQRLVGADSQVGSLSFSVCGSVAMRKDVIRQIKKPIEKSTMRPMRFPMDMLSFMIIGSGRKKMMRSVMRFVIEFVHLNLLATSRIASPTQTYRCHAKFIQVPGIVRSYTRGIGLHWKMETNRYATVHATLTPIMIMQSLRKLGIGKTR